MKDWLRNRFGGGPPTKNEIGRMGEDAAAKELRRRGYRILERNFRCSLGEIDIVAEEDGEIVIVEVKTRSAGAHADPQDSVTPAKAARLIKLGRAYLARHDREDADWRIDVVAVRTGGPGRVGGGDHPARRTGVSPAASGKKSFARRVGSRPGGDRIECYDEYYVAT